MENKDNNEKLSQKQIWNKIAEKWTRFRNKSPKEVEEFLKDKEGNILDLGCGSGRNFTKNTRQKLYAVDFSEEMVKFARINAEELGIDADIKLMNITNLEFKDNFFDAAIFISTLHCLESSKLRKKALEELFRVLKPRAQTIITVWKKDKSKKTEWINKEGDNKEKINRYYYFYDKEELKNLLEKVGFKILATKEFEEGKHSKKNIIFYVEK